jgi:putative nucleotidyltransferase with HDIG domain
MLATETLVKTEEYFPIILEALRLDTILEFDLYIKIEGQFVLYRHHDLPFTEEVRLSLIENNVKYLYVSSKLKKKYQIYIEDNLDKIVEDKKIELPKKAIIIYDTSKNLVQDVFENPTYGENIKRSGKLVENTMNYILKGKEAFINLMRITSRDYTTYTHSVHVSCLCTALAIKLGYKDRKSLYELGLGALLHDVGKSKIDEKILKKRGKLDKTEFDLMKKHPQWGVEILSKSHLPKDAYVPIIEHHERVDSTGYPRGIGGNNIGLYGKVAGIVDVFDALTTERVYQEALTPYNALRVITDLRGKFDASILKEFILLLGLKF